IAPRIFLLRELLVDGVTVVRRVAHVGERERLVELGAYRLPRLRPDRAARLFVHGVVSSWLIEIACGIDGPARRMPDMQDQNLISGDAIEHDIRIAWHRHAAMTSIINARPDQWKETQGIDR